VRTRNELGDLAQTFNYMSQQLMAYDAETRGLYKSLEEGYLETIVALANSIDSKDSYTRGHSQRVGEMAAEIGREMGLPELDVRHLLYGGILHDIGKIGVIEPILCKRSRLTDEEMAVMREHPAMGATIIDGVSVLRPVMAAVRNHHERWDGNGYPDKLAGDAIPLIARIVNCADTWDACTSTRPYQKAMPPEKALEIVRKLSGTQLDPKVVDALERVVHRKQARGERVSAWDPSDDERVAAPANSDASGEEKKAVAS
jgi:putative nucleotidyltransferase with HDIG domain